MQNFSLRWQSWKARQAHPHASEPPLRADLFSVEQLALHARALALGHQTASGCRPNSLLAQLAENERIIQTFIRATRTANPNRRITAAAEWLLDNFYLIEEQIQMARRHLPRGYSRELPRLLAGPSAGLPRVYDIVLELIAHVDAQIDGEPLVSFVASYQKASSLKLGELWAVPIMLRLGLIENLQRIITRLTIAREDRDLADVWVNRLQDMAESNPSQLVVVVADMARSDIPLTSAFVAEFCQLLSRHSPVLHLARSWLEHRLTEQGLSIERLVDLESQSQAADQVSVSHSIASLRFLSATDWKEFVETLSLVETTLNSDPSDHYAAMDFATRDRYRHVVEAIARHSRLTEAEVAQVAVQLAADAARRMGRADRSAHVGFYLIDRGLKMLERRAEVRWSLPTRVERAIQRLPLAFYVGGIALVTLLVTCGFVHLALALGTQRWMLVLLSLVFVPGASQLAVALLNWLSTLLVKPCLLPRLDYSSGIAPDCRTMVVVPTMLTHAEGIDRLIESLEIHYLANRDEHLHFAILTDYRDADAEHLPGDQKLLRRVQTSVEMLNRKYGTGGHHLFFLFHRPRRWNAGEGLWMGYERKRGKLEEFNSLLRGGSTEVFSKIIGEMTILPLIRYVITLDTDTQLPRDAARRLVGTMAHPLNHPVFDDPRGIVTSGYPSRYNVDVSRRHRWMRGDWQIIQWLLPRVPDTVRQRVANPLTGLSLWKIFDNLRRSLVPIALMLFLSGAWFLTPMLGKPATLLVILILTLPGLLSWLLNTLRKPPSLPWSMHLRETTAAGGRQFAQILLTLTFLPYDALVSADAIGRTLTRLLVTHTKLLEWQTSSDFEQTRHAHLSRYYATMWIAPLVALLCGLGFVLLRSPYLTLALPILAAWIAAPWIAWWISQPITSAVPSLTSAQSAFLRGHARKTWHYFESLVTAGENWLPPDNIQEVPSPMIAPRTSPTNMGLALLANLAARDFGYLPVAGLIERTQNTLATMHQLERHRGHFYNWYDTTGSMSSSTINTAPSACRASA